MNSEEDKKLAKELVEVISRTGESISSLVHKTADFIEEYKQVATLAVPTVREVQEEIIANTLKNVLPNETFWNEVISMHNEVSLIVVIIETWPSCF